MKVSPPYAMVRATSSRQATINAGAPSHQRGSRPEPLRGRSALAVLTEGDDTATSPERGQNGGRGELCPERSQPPVCSSSCLGSRRTHHLAAHLMTVLCRQLLLRPAHGVQGRSRALTMPSPHPMLSLLRLFCSARGQLPALGFDTENHI